MDGRDLRPRITSTVTLLTAFYQGVTRHVTWCLLRTYQSGLINPSSAIFEIQNALDQLRIDIQSGRLEGSLKSVNTIQLAEDDEDAWSVLIRVMEDLGITAEVVNNHRSLVLEWIVKTINAGVFQELAPVEVTEVAETAPMLNSFQTRSRKLWIPRYSSLLILS